ncbi:MAG: hypothetical protein Q9P44_09600, partial [Anaerolineae bacterium]|nr:hypothetical protein [Anaerolineae bacterium]
ILILHGRWLNFPLFIEMIHSQFLLQMPYDGSEIIYKFIDEFKEEREREGFEYKIRKQSSTK